MALMSLRSRSHVKASVVLTIEDHLCIHNYIRSLLNSILRPILLVRKGLSIFQQIYVNYNINIVKFDNLNYIMKLKVR